MQLLPSTFATMGTGFDIFNPAQNINAGTKDLPQLIKKYGSFRAALAYGYNPLPGGQPNWKYADYIMGQGVGPSGGSGAAPSQAGGPGGGHAPGGDPTRAVV